MLQMSMKVMEVLGFLMRPAALSSFAFDVMRRSHCADLKALPEPTPPYRPGALE